MTICTYRRECLFGQVEDGGMVLSQYGHLVERCWQILPRHFHSVELDTFVVMPNHIHSIIILTGCHTEGRGEAFAQRSREQPHLKSANASPLRLAHGTQSGSLGAIVQNFKSVSTRKINQVRKAPHIPIWQRNYYEHIIRTEEELHSLRQYIVNNPLQWTLDQENPVFWNKG